MVKPAKPIRVTGILEKDGRIRPDRPVPLPPGPVSVSVTPRRNLARVRTKVPRLLDLAGSAREMLAGVDVDQELRDLRAEWDRKID